jgi:putative phosphoribosyl transferase
MAAHEEVRLVSIPAAGMQLEGELALPEAPRGVVLFAHGSASSRHSPRNRYVAQSLRTEAQVGTLLFDLLSEAEGQEDLRTARLRFDVELLARRVEAAAVWLRETAATRPLATGYFGSSTGAAAALVAAARRPDVAAIVSRGGRPDLVSPEMLARVRAPTLFIVGGEDIPVIDLNRQTAKLLRVEHYLDVIPNASHLFEEPGTLEQVARRAAVWFETHFPPHSRSTSVDHARV